ncbi:MAG: hypothetical protein ACXWU5_08600 [Rhodoplanes sp.]|nr:hypothetical protein [Rhodoplanes sp.]
MSPFYASEKAVTERANLLREVAHELLDSGVLPADRIVLREPRIRLLTQGYFLLNKAYKDWRIPEGHANELIRIAALHAVTIVRFQPFMPLDPANAQDLAEARCNEIFALVYALGTLGCKLALDGSGKVDFWLRVLDIMTEATVETLAPFIADINRQAERPLEDYALTLHARDKLVVNSLISIFELVSNSNSPEPLLP